MRFLADENVEWTVVESLRKQGFDVVAAHTDYKGFKDNEILQLAHQQKRILITNDTDFGNLVFHRQQLSSGIILMRFLNENSNQKAKTIQHLLKHHSAKLQNHFTVLSEHQIRIKPL